MTERTESGPTVTITAASFLDCAERYIAAACVLIERRTPVDPIGLLASHGLELTLKAYLIYKGVSVAALKRKDRRHNLEELWIDAATRGLAIGSPPWWLRILSFYYDFPYQYRYPTHGQAPRVHATGFEPSHRRCQRRSSRVPETPRQSHNLPRATQGHAAATRLTVDFT